MKFEARKHVEVNAHPTPAFYFAHHAGLLDPNGACLLSTGVVARGW